MEATSNRPEEPRSARGALFRAILTKADLRFAQLQDVRLDYAQLQGASFQGAFLRRMQPSDSVVENIFSPAGQPPNWHPEYAPHFEANPEAWTVASYVALRRSIEREVPEGEKREDALKRVAILDCARKGDTLASCDASADPPDAVKQWQKMIGAASVDQVAYTKALAAILGDLLCSNEPDRIEVLRGLLHSDRFMQTGNEMSALAKRITSAKCPVSVALTGPDKSALGVALEEAVVYAKRGF